MTWGYWGRGPDDPEPSTWRDRAFIVLFWVVVAIMTVFAFIVLTSALMWSTVAELVRAFARATQWSPQ